MPPQPAKLVPFKPGQHKVTAVPKIASDLPFFNLVQNRRGVPTTIKYQDTDTQGRHVRWEVYPDTSAEIGPPGVEAHRVYHLLVKPSIDAARDPATRLIPELIPLGGVRECLRKVGWTPGGRQARELLKVLTQIAFAGCVADFYLPTGEINEDGKESYFSLKGRFSKMSVYAIGERHLTDEELKAASFDFDLEDTIYIRLDALEARILQTQEERFLDNQYLFAVGPAARRWYELVAPKIFGVVKHTGTHCDIRYSWYIRRHHTLKRYHERYRVVFQMNRVVQDHIDSGYISKVQYFAVTEPGQETDYLIRYYPGPAAGESIKRILTNINPRKKGISANKPKLHKSQSAFRPLEKGSDNDFSHISPDQTPALTEQQRDLRDTLTRDFRVAPDKAEQIVRANTQSTKFQLEVWPFRKTAPENLAGWIIKAINNNYEPPQAYLDLKRSQEADQRQREIHQDQLREQEEHNQASQEARARADELLKSLPVRIYQQLYDQVKANLLSRSAPWARGLSDEALHEAVLREMRLHLQQQEPGESYLQPTDHAAAELEKQ
jgi:hypothetical protein